MDQFSVIERLEKARRIVIKIGSAVIVNRSRDIDTGLLESITNDIAYLIGDLNKEIVVVSSGAVASGMAAMGLRKKPDNIIHQQALAAIGQPELMQLYKRLFQRFGITVSQVLIAIDDIQNRRRFINAKNALLTLIKWKSLPVVNENDTVVVKELCFGDNDNLSSHVVNLTEADVLLMLSNVDGVYDKDPSEEGARLLRVVPSDFDAASLKGSGELGAGGIRSKVEAGRRVAALGKIAIVLNGTRRGILRDLFNGREVLYSLFEPASHPISSKESWISSGVVAGAIVVDDGAKRSLLKHKSLLASGIVKVYGSFERGDIVSIESVDGRVIARGITNYDSLEIERIKGLHSSRIAEVLGYKYSNDVVHIDNMVLFEETGRDNA